MAVGPMGHPTYCKHIPILGDWGSFCPEWGRTQVPSTLLLTGKSDRFCGNWSIFESSLVDLCPEENLIFQSVGKHTGQVHVHADIDSEGQQAICQVESHVTEVKLLTSVKTERGRWKEGGEGTEGTHHTCR